MITGGFTMTYDIIFVLSLLGGAIGWSLFAYSVVTTYCSRKKEMQMLEYLSKDLKEIKKEIKELK
jgi:hypothetical protein